MRKKAWSSRARSDPRWWNAVCWERSDLVKEGLMRVDSDRGVWEISDEGKNLPALLLDGTEDRVELAVGSFAEMAAKYWTGELSKVALMVGDTLFHPILFETWDELELSVRSCNCLRNAGVHYLGDLVQLTEQELLNMPNMQHAQYGSKGLGGNQRRTRSPQSEDRHQATRRAREVC
jgi:RNA polymerase alpha subunit